MPKITKGRNGGTLLSTLPGESGNPNGRPKGIRNRSTIAKQVMSMRVTPPAKVVEKLKELYPEMQDRFKAEEIATMQQMMKAMKGDTRAYQVLMDMAYEPHKQKQQLSGEEGTKIIVEKRITNATEDNQS